MTNSPLTEEKRAFTSYDKYFDAIALLPNKEGTVCWVKDVASAVALLKEKIEIIIKRTLGSSDIEALATRTSMMTTMRKIDECFPVFKENKE